MLKVCGFEPWFGYALSSCFLCCLGWLLWAEFIFQAVRTLVCPNGLENALSLEERARDDCYNHAAHVILITSIR
jgi:hypothetical protein